jgi:hypothetical protein
LGEHSEINRVFRHLWRDAIRSLLGGDRFMVRLSLSCLCLGLAVLTSLASEPPPASRPGLTPDQLRSDLSKTVDAERESLARRLQALIKIKACALEMNDTEAFRRAEDLEKAIYALQDEKYLMHQSFTKDLQLAEAKLLKQKQEEDSRLAERRDRNRPAPQRR